jgi:hypothetical protein
MDAVERTVGRDIECTTTRWVRQLDGDRVETLKDGS